MHFRLFLFFAIFVFPILPRKLAPEVRLLDGHKSPLDEDPPEDDYYYHQSAEKPAVEDFPGGGGNEPNFGQQKELPLCQRECLAKFSETAKAAIQSVNNYDRFNGVCDNYNQTVDCMDKLKGEKCANQDTFHVLTSGLRYMCIEQRKAFEAVIECIDAQASEVEKECEGVCHVKERLAHWAVQSGILDNFMQGALSSLATGEAFGSQVFGRDAGLGALTGSGGLLRNGEMTRAALEDARRAAAAATVEGIKNAAKARNRGDSGGIIGAEGKLPKWSNLPPAQPISKRLTPDFMRAIVQDGCELTRCQLICIRVKFDAKCGGSAGTLLSEAFVRPISQAQEFLSYGSIAPFMGAFLPHQCDFMVKKEVLNEFRIPPELDDALHNKYDSGGNEEAGNGGGEGVALNEMDQQDKNKTLESNGIGKGESIGGQPPSLNGPPDGSVPVMTPPESAIPVVHVPGISPDEGMSPLDNENNAGQNMGGFGQPKPKDVEPGDINQVSHVVGRTAPRKGIRPIRIF